MLFSPPPVFLLSAQMKQLDCIVLNFQFVSELICIAVRLKNLFSFRFICWDEKFGPTHSCSKNISNNSGLHNWSPSNRFAFSFQLISVGMFDKWVSLSLLNGHFGSLYLWKCMNFERKCWISFPWISYVKFTHVGRSPTSTITKWVSGDPPSMPYFWIKGSAAKQFNFNSN